MSDLDQANLAKAQAKQNLWYNKTAREKEFLLRQQVLVLLPSSTSKLQAEWQGPYSIVNKIGSVNYQDRMSDKLKKLHIFHVNMLKE